MEMKSFSLQGAFKVHFPLLWGRGDFSTFPLKKSAETSPTHSGEKQNSIFTNFLKNNFRMKKNKTEIIFQNVWRKSSFAFPLNEWVMFLRRNSPKRAKERGVFSHLGWEVLFFPCVFSSASGATLSR